MVEKDCSWFSLEGLKLQLYVYSVYDGDTFCGVFVHPDGKQYKQRFRMLGYDSAELHMKKAEKEKLNEEQFTIINQKAKKAKEMLSGMILNKKINVICGKNEKYGRTLVTINYNDDLTVNQIMIESGLVNKYDGKTKQTFEQDQN